MAEEAGFEPAGLLHPLTFQVSALNQTRPLFRDLSKEGGGVEPLRVTVPKISNLVADQPAAPSINGSG